MSCACDYAYLVGCCRLVVLMQGLFAAMACLQDGKILSRLVRFVDFIVYVVVIVVGTDLFELLVKFMLFWRSLMFILYWCMLGLGSLLQGQCLLTWWCLLQLYVGMALVYCSRLPCTVFAMFDRSIGVECVGLEMVCVARDLLWCRLGRLLMM